MEEFADVKLINSDGIFRIAKQMSHTNQDFLLEPCVCNDVGTFMAMHVGAALQSAVQR